MKSRLSQLDFGIQILGLIFFVIITFNGQVPASTSLLLCILFLGLWQILSAAFWGLVYADYHRSQFLMVAIFTLGGAGIILSLPEFRDSEFILLLSRFGAILMIGFYLHLSFRDVMGILNSPPQSTYI